MKNKIITFIFIILIIGAIWYLEKEKNHSSGNVKRIELAKDNLLKEARYSKAVELVEPDGYINQDNITLAEYLGKEVILVDFWTYSCINCQRTIPYLNAWYEKYKDKGFVIIGVHTPEFDFEKDYNNVKKAVDKYNIKYPVVQDNNYKTWRAYENRYWPRKYLIDIDGFIVYDHIGEGGYEETEKEIQKALQEREDRMNIDADISNEIAKPNVNLPEFQEIETPEIYFGYDFSRNQIGNKEGYDPEKIVNYTLPEKYENNKFYLGGIWLNNKDNLESEDNNSIVIKYHAKDINLVAGANNPTEISIYIDDNFTRKLIISDYSLYNIYSDDNYTDHLLEIKTKKGIKVFTFTFG